LEISNFLNCKNYEKLKWKLLFKEKETIETTSRLISCYSSNTVNILKNNFVFPFGFYDQIIPINILEKSKYFKNFRNFCENEKFKEKNEKSIKNIKDYEKVEIRRQEDQKMYFNPPTIFLFNVKKKKWKEVICNMYVEEREGLIFNFFLVNLKIFLKGHSTVALNNEEILVFGGRSFRFSKFNKVQYNNEIWILKLMKVEKNIFSKIFKKKKTLFGEWFKIILFLFNF
jgi:hypothetical protein